ncbi:MAG TPA: AAA family ATPase [Candidatus Eremiobacteraceae bacterium]|nr:AAA family ATPase [Candidatus Eremiobacteraceae bacterium]
MISTPIFCRRLIGRRRELCALVERRRDLAKAHGGVVLIAGDAGIGKSRLLREFLETTRTSRGRVCVAQCRPFGSRPYGPILELLEAFAPERAGIMPADSQNAQHKTLVDSFLGASDKHALIGVVEDFHWADRGTAAILVQLSEAIAARRILLVVTYRSDELHVEHPLYTSLGNLMRSRGVRPVEIAPLSQREAAELIDATLEEHAASVSRQTRRDIARAGEGNPFFTEELLKSAVDRERASRIDSSLPTTVRAAILQRMEPLDGRDRLILTQAAVIGRRFDGLLLAQTLDTSFESLLPTLQRARRCQLVEETDEPHTFRFRHALTREAIYDDLLVAQRKPLHERIALALESADEERSLDAMAYHWWASGDREKALRYGERAGDMALRLYEYGGAIAAYERSLGLLDPLGRDAARVYEKIGTCHFRAGLMDRAVDHYAPAWSYFRSTRDDPAYLFRLTRNTAGALFNDGRAHEAIALWREAIPIIRACGDSRIADLARVTFASYLIDDGDVAQTVATLDSIAEVSLDDDPELGLPFWAVTSVAAAFAGDRGRLRTAVDHLCSMRRERALLGPLNDALGEAGSAALYVGETACARRCLEGALDACIAFKSSAMLMADTLLGNAFERVLAGDYALAKTQYRKALALLGETKVSWYRAWCVALWVGLATGDAALVGDDLDPGTFDAAFATGKAQLYGPLAAAYSDVLLARGDRKGARELLRRAVAAAKTTLSLGSFPLVVAAAMSCEASDADAVVTLCARDAEKGPAPAAAAALADAIIARRFGDPREAVHSAKKAADGFAVVGWPFYESIARDEAGESDAARSIRKRIGYVESQPARPTDEGNLGTLLTGREIEIARLVSSGQTNREIARSLSVSVKLVEKQLSLIYRKLSIRSRSQLTARLLSSEHLGR